MSTGRTEANVTAEIVAVVLMIVGLLSPPARADDFVVPTQIQRKLERDSETQRFEAPLTRVDSLTVDEWTDPHRRVAFHRTASTQLSSVMRFPRDNWSDYQIIMWQPHTAIQDAALKTLGITAGMVQADRHGRGAAFVAQQQEPLLANNMSWYVENIATDFYSPYHRWFPDHPPDWTFLAVQKLYRENPRNIAAFTRHPSLSDPVWLARIHDRLVNTVEAERKYRPLYYSLGDETGIADLSAFWDFDFSEASLRGMREWLKEEYGSLSALNQEWGTSFAQWKEVVPPTTDETFARRDDNFSGWSDFKEWMDVAFARAIKMGTDAVHTADAEASSAIEGAQRPGWGGYDYTRLVHAVDVMELYDYGNNVEIVRSLNPRTIILTTSFESGRPEEHRVWQELFRGSRGLILWDPNNGFVRKDGTPGPRGQTAAGYFDELRSGLGALFINSKRRNDGIDILYSPASMRAAWMLDQRARLAAGERVSMSRGSQWDQPDPVISSIGWFSAALEHMGLRPSFVSRGMIEQGTLRTDSSRILVLPYAIALSPREAAEMRDFTKRGGVLLADGQPGRFDEHGQRLSKPLLEDLFRGKPSAAPASDLSSHGKASYLDMPTRSSDGAVIHGQDAIRRLADTLKTAGIEPAFSLRGPAGAVIGDVRIYVYDNSNVEIVALQRDLGTWLSGFGKERLTLNLSRPSFVYDLRRNATLGQIDCLNLALDEYEPAIFAISRTPLPGPTISGPTQLKLGQLAKFEIGLSGTPLVAEDVIHIDVVGPDGSVIPDYSGNILLRDGAASKLLPVAVNDPPGKWTFRVTDVVSGQTALTTLDVSAFH